MLWLVSTLGQQGSVQPDPLFTPERAEHLLALGMARPHMPCYVMSAAVAAVNLLAEQQQLRPCSPPGTRMTQPQVVLRALGCLRSTLFVVLLPGGEACAACDAGATGQLLAAVDSPADVAAALTAALTALQLMIRLQAQGLAGSFSAQWLQLLSACASILSALTLWLVEADGSFTVESTRDPTGGAAAGDVRPKTAGAAAASTDHSIGHVHGSPSAPTALGVMGAGPAADLVRTAPGNMLLAPRMSAWQLQALFECN